MNSMSTTRTHQKADCDLEAQIYHMNNTNYQVYQNRYNVESEEGTKFCVASKYFQIEHFQNQINNVTDTNQWFMAPPYRPA